MIPKKSIKKSKIKTKGGAFGTRSQYIYPFDNSTQKTSENIQDINNYFKENKLIKVNLQNVDDLSEFEGLFEGTYVREIKGLIGKKLPKSMFKDCQRLEEIDLSECDLSGAESLCNNCTNLKEIIGLNGKTLAPSMFTNCRNLKIIDLTGCNLEHTDSIFYNCVKLETIVGLSGKLSPKMFAYCKLLQEINLTDCDLSNTAKIFYMCERLSSVNGILGTNESRRILSKSMFNSCISLKEIDISYCDCQNAEELFYMCETLDEIIGLSGKLSPYMFGLCYSLKKIDLSSCNLSNSTRIFLSCNNLETVSGLSGPLSNEMFSHCMHLTKINLFHCKLTNVESLFTSARVINGIILPRITNNNNYDERQLLNGLLDINTNEKTPIFRYTFQLTENDQLVKDIVRSVDKYCNRTDCNNEIMQICTELNDNYSSFVLSDILYSPYKYMVKDNQGKIIPDAEDKYLSFNEGWIHIMTSPTIDGPYTRYPIVELKADVEVRNHIYKLVDKIQEIRSSNGEKDIKKILDLSTIVTQNDLAWQYCQENPQPPRKKQKKTEFNPSKEAGTSTKARTSIPGGKKISKKKKKRIKGNTKKIVK